MDLNFKQVLLLLLQNRCTRVSFKVESETNSTNEGKWFNCSVYISLNIET